MKKIEKLLIIKEYFPNAKIELNYETNFQLLVAVMLSAQTTDIMVNRATKELFKKNKESFDFEKLSYDEIYQHIKIVGLSKSKTKYLMKLSKQVSQMYSGEVVNNKQKLMDLSGVGPKTANAVLANLYGEQYLAVDTHVQRISKRLNLVKQKDTAGLEKTFNIDKFTAASLKKFTIEPIINDASPPIVSNP